MLHVNQGKPPHLLDFADLKARKISRSRAYRALGDGKLSAVKMGSRTFVTAESVEAFLAALPAATFRAPTKRAA